MNRQKKQEQDWSLGPDNKLRVELHALAERAESALATAEEISPDFPCRDDLVGYVQRAVVALRDAEMTLIG